MSDTPKTQEELLKLRPEVEQFMKQYPGVVGVGLGFKMRSGKMTEEIAFRVYVTEKKPLAQLKPEEVIPASYNNVPTDVLTVPRSVGHADTTPCADRAQHSPLIGGITITTLKPQADGTLGVGTIGFFATFAGVDPPYNIVLVTNQHVFADASGAVGDTIYQPQWAKQPDGSIAPLLTQPDVVGKILNMPPKADDKNGSYVDAASAQLNICISSWCHTNCGVSFANEIKGLAINNSNAIADVSNTLNVGDVVYKVGRTTGRTVGKVTALAIPLIIQGGTTVHNNIEIQGTAMQTADNCGGALRFSDEGDSGSAVIDSNRKLVGLLHGGDPGNPVMSHACHIQPVLDALGVVPITEANPVHNNPAAEGMRADVPAIIDGRPNQTAVLRARFLGSDEGRHIWEIVERHRHEVVHLVNHNRRVTVAWRRHEGPAFLNRAMNNVRDPEERIPHAIAGVTRQTLLVKMADALTQHGSPELRKAIEENCREVLAHAEQYDSLHDLVDSLIEKQPL